MPRLPQIVLATLFLGASASVIGAPPPAGAQEVP
jgi:hypothetical protein